MSTPSCGACAFFIRTGTGGSWNGVCARFPKHEDKHEADWCGEWKTANPVGPYLDVKIKEPAK
jgi:hypothetical protein